MKGQRNSKNGNLGVGRRMKACTNYARMGRHDDGKGYILCCKSASCCKSAPRGKFAPKASCIKISANDPCDPCKILQHERTSISVI